MRKQVSVVILRRPGNEENKIICTVGPSTDNIPLLVSMLKAGMDMARFNFSHGSHSDHAQRLGLVREAAGQVNKPIAMIADTRGLRCAWVFLNMIKLRYRRAILLPDHKGSERQ